MREQTYLQQARALGTQVEFRIDQSNKEDAESIFRHLWLKTERFQNRFSRFIPTSEVSKLNANHGNKTKISDDFAKILDKTVELAKLTEGIFNPFCLPLVQKAGYTTSLDSLNSQAPIDYTDRVLSDIDELTIGQSWAMIPKNSAIDLGGIGKGYLADQLSEYLDRSGVDNYLLSIGGDLVAKGDPRHKKWTIDVPSAIDNRIIARYYPNQNKFSVATSGLARSLDGKKQLHLIDPRSQKLAKSQYLTCSVASIECTFADVIASCILIDGISFAKKMLKLNIISGVLLQGKAHNSVDILGEGFMLENNHTYSKKKVSNIHA